MDWTPAFAGGDSLYGESIATRRWEVIGQYQLPVNGKVMAQFSANGHQQRSWYGTTPYNADQRVFFGQLYGNKRFGMRHDVLYGVAYRHTWYDDNTVGTSQIQNEEVRNSPQELPLPGLFLQDEWSITEMHKSCGDRWRVTAGTFAQCHLERGSQMARREALLWSRWLAFLHAFHQSHSSGLYHGPGPDHLPQLGWIRCFSWCKLEP